MDKRRSIEVGGVKHVNPIPSASKKGPFAVSGAISGADPETGKVPVELDAQCRQMFDNVRRVMAAAGGTLLVDVHGQRENLSLLAPRKQGSKLTDSGRAVDTHPHRVILQELVLDARDDEPVLGRDVPRPAFAAGPPYDRAARFHAPDADPMRPPRRDRRGVSCIDA